MIRLADGNFSAMASDSEPQPQPSSSILTARRPARHGRRFRQVRSLRLRPDFRGRLGIGSWNICAQAPGSKQRIPAAVRNAGGFGGIGVLGDGVGPHGAGELRIGARRRQPRVVGGDHPPHPGPDHKIGQGAVLGYRPVAAVAKLMGPTLTARSLSQTYAAPIGLDQCLATAACFFSLAVMGGGYRKAAAGFAQVALSPSECVRLPSLASAPRAKTKTGARRRRFLGGNRVRHRQLRPLTRAARAIPSKGAMGLL